ncbi:MAG: rRNA maturation RNase YbeY [bacterium]|nr:rRNA maturation RNase YbeY [bacterium]
MFSVIISSDSRYQVNKTVLLNTAVKSLESHGLKGQVEMEINIIGDRKMHDLNKKYRNLDYTTDILTFALEDPNPQNAHEMSRVGFIASPDHMLRLGLICISYPQAVVDALDDGKSVEEEIVFLVDHGINHLLGFHHG